MNSFFYEKVKKIDRLNLNYHTTGIGRIRYYR